LEKLESIISENYGEFLTDYSVKSYLTAWLAWMEATQAILNKPLLASVTLGPSHPRGLKDQLVGFSHPNME